MITETFLPDGYMLDVESLLDCFRDTPERLSKTGLIAVIMQLYLERAWTFSIRSEMAEKLAHMLDDMRASLVQSLDMDTASGDLSEVERAKHNMAIEISLMLHDMYEVVVQCAGEKLPGKEFKELLDSMRSGKRRLDKRREPRRREQRKRTS